MSPNNNKFMPKTAKKDNSQKTVSCTRAFILSHHEDRKRKVNWWFGHDEIWQLDVFINVSHRRIHELILGPNSSFSLIPFLPRPSPRLSPPPPSPRSRPLKSSYKGSGGALWAPPGGVWGSARAEFEFGRLHFSLEILRLVATVFTIFYIIK
jgi:hypothetical protein